MRKHLLLCLTFFLTYQSYSQSNNWMISSEVSPMSRSGNERVLNDPSAINLEWRNRVGFKIGEQTMMGLSASYRHYRLMEEYHTVQSPIGNRYQLSNHLLGIGTFITQYFHLTPRFHLQSTVYAMVEQGKGSYETSAIVPPNSMAPILQSNMVPSEYYYRERNFFAGLEFGASYFLTPTWILQTNINLLQFENFRNTNAGKRTLPLEIPRQVEQEGSGFSFLTDRTIVHFGVMVLLGKK